MTIRKLAKHSITTALLSVSCATFAAPWAVVANGGTTDDVGIHTIDFGTTPPSVFGPHLGAELNPTGSGGLFDATVSPNGQFALVSNFNKEVVYRVDLSDPKQPTLSATIPMTGFFAEDIEISPDGRWAVVSDGGFNSNLYFIDLTSNTTTQFTLPSGAAQAVTISPDGRHVIIIDYFGEDVIYGEVSPTRDSIVNLNSLPVPRNPSTPTDSSGPVNVAINPSGNLVLVAATGSKQIVPYTFSGGVLATGTPIDLPAAPQSIVFSPTANNRAYALLSATTGSPAAPPQVVEMNLSGGVVSLTGRAVNTLGTGSSQLFGVDTLAISSDGSILVATNSTFSSASTAISRIDVSNFDSIPIELNTQFPGGVDFIPNARPIPTLSQWAIVLLILLTAFVFRLQKTSRRL